MFVSRIFVSLTTTCTLLTQVLALSSPPSGAITIGPNGKYAKISDGLADKSSSVYFIYAGTYKEQVNITRPNLKIYGETQVPLSYSGNTVTITNNIPASIAGSNDLSGTVRVEAANVSLYNLNIANTVGAGTDKQAIALSVQEGQFGAYGLKLTGYQDTLLANVGSEFYGNCWIEGATDFIFGMRASIWITHSVINTVASGWITASGRSSDDANWYVIDHSTIQGTGTAYLGRPWRDYARVVFQNSVLNSNVPSAGWSIWNTGTPQTDHVTFAEYNNSGAGAAGSRASFATKLSAPVSITTVLGSTSWVDSQFLL
ncbi:pectin lyase-like protein [Irpex rosettiformis]|uniref:Pectin lyase-like protein n=1 Tax=Irpex rosettiformis TaxID=378272 RepID=A0ACB8UC59_9APHY|nr:pectin lyase-like protein [Irpex rosettiformis]